MRLGLADLRDGRLGVVTCLDLVASRPQIVAIPPGVAHGFLFVEPSLHVYAVDRTWDPDDELGCRWDDPQLAIPWIGDADRVSPRDAALGTLADLRSELAAAARS
jgi:dTDP-4-dehydrorhamnose 3,5-epimerase-like enzyme